MDGLNVSDPAVRIYLLTHGFTNTDLGKIWAQQTGHKFAFAPAEAIQGATA